MVGIGPGWSGQPKGRPYGDEKQELMFSCLWGEVRAPGSAPCGRSGRCQGRAREDTAEPPEGFIKAAVVFE